MPRSSDTPGTVPQADTPAPDAAPLTTSAKENIDVVAAFHERENAQVSGIRIAIESISAFFGSPTYFAAVIGFVLLWVGVNSWGLHEGWPYIDEPPFFWLQGIVSSNALLLTVAVLIRQNRMAQLAEQRAHLDLQINLLTEQKVTKLLELVDELRHAEPAVDKSTDAEGEELRQPADPEALLAAIKQSSTKR